jgi:pimeloyl-ACP methyl ester carboxylesterase
VYQTVLATWWHAGLYVGKGTDAVDPTLGNPLVDRSCRFHRERSVSGLASEARDIARHMPGQTFAIVGDAHVRYRLLRAKLPGADVVVPSGLKGSIEQAKDFQWAVSSAVPSLAYDRAGYGFNEGSTAHSAELTRRLVVRFLIVALALVASTLLTELALEARDVARYMPGQTFATVGDARIRYRLLGAERPGATVVFLSGLNGSIEQADHFQRAVSSAVPSLAYDRAGYGFSEGSTAHSAEQQAKELAALLHALKLEGSVVLVAYSISSLLARVFADRFPEKTAGMYLIEPAMPELNERMPQLHTPRRHFVSFIVHQLLASSLGYIRLTQRVRSWQGPTSLVEQRAEAVLARRPHYWAQAQEWYALPESCQRTLDAQIPPALPLEVAFSKHASENETSKAVALLYAELVARSSRGKLVELEEGLDHRQVLQPGPMFDRMIASIQLLAQPDALKLTGSASASHTQPPYSCNIVGRR